jgi:hypothetical protein
MSFGTQHPREYIEDKHGELNRAVNNVLSAALPVRLSPPERALYTPPRSLLLGRWSARLRNEQWSGLIKKLLRQHP